MEFMTYFLAVLAVSMVFFRPITYTYLFVANLLLASKGKPTVKIK